MCGDVLPHAKYLSVSLILLYISFSTSAPIPNSTAAANQTANATHCAFPGFGDGARVTDIKYVWNHSDSSGDRYNNETTPTNFADTAGFAFNQTDIGNLNQSSVFGLNTSLIYTCDDNHALVSGSLLLVCTETGDWDNIVPKCAVLSSIGRAQIVAPLIAILALLLLILLPLDFWNYRRKKERIRELFKRGRREDRNKVRPLPFYIKQQAAHPYFGGVWTTHLLADGQQTSRSDVTNAESLIKGEDARDTSGQPQSEQEPDGYHNKERRKKSKFRNLKRKNKPGKVSPFDEEDYLTDEKINHKHLHSNVSDVASEPLTPRANRRTLPPIRSKDILNFTDGNYDEHLRELNIRPMMPISTLIFEEDESFDKINAVTNESRDAEQSLSYIDALPEPSPRVARKPKKERRLKNRFIEDKTQNEELNNISKSPRDYAENLEVVFSKRSQKYNKADSAIGGFDHEKRRLKYMREDSAIGSFDQTNGKSHHSPDTFEKRKPVAPPRKTVLSKELSSYVNESFEDDYQKQFSDDGVYSDDGRVSYKNAKVGFHENV